MCSLDVVQGDEVSQEGVHNSGLTYLIVLETCSIIPLQKPVLDLYPSAQFLIGSCEVEVEGSVQGIENSPVELVYLLNQIASVFLSLLELAQSKQEDYQKGSQIELHFRELSQLGQNILGDFEVLVELCRVSGKI